MAEELKQKAEMALNKRLGTYGYVNKDICYKPYTEGYIDGFLAGLHEVQPKWHKPCEMLPKDEKEVLVYMWDSYYIGYYSQRTEENRRWHFEEFSEETEQITAWCEILQFKE